MYRCGLIIGHFTLNRMIGYILSGSSIAIIGVLVSSRDLEIRTGRPMADGMTLPRVITNE